MDSVIIVGLFISIRIGERLSVNQRPHFFAFPSVCEEDLDIKKRFNDLQIYTKTIRLFSRSRFRCVMGDSS